MADLVYGELHAVMRGQEIERRVRQRALDRLEEQEKVPNYSNEWHAEDEPIVI